MRAVRLLDGQARRALAAADVVLVASGTATLETALFKRPMVVAYRLGAITAFLLRTLGLVKIKHFSQPNLLRGRGAGAGILPGSGESPRISRTHWRTGSSIPTRSRECSRSSRRSTRACAAMAPSAPRRKSAALRRRRGRCRA